jgi:hypothetical protein
MNSLSGFCECPCWGGVAVAVDVIGVTGVGVKGSDWMSV